MQSRPSALGATASAGGRWQRSAGRFMFIASALRLRPRDPAPGLSVHGELCLESRLVYVLCVSRISARASQALSRVPEALSLSESYVILANFSICQFPPLCASRG